LSERAISRGRCVNTLSSRSSASLRCVTRADHFRLDVFFRADDFLRDDVFFAVDLRGCAIAASWCYGRLTAQPEDRSTRQTVTGEGK
jgi:hypothetical protein